MKKEIPPKTLDTFQLVVLSHLFHMDKAVEAFGTLYGWGEDDIRQLFLRPSPCVILRGIKEKDTHSVIEACEASKMRYRLELERVV